MIERAAVSERMIADGLRVLENSVHTGTAMLRASPGPHLAAMADVLRQAYETDRPGDGPDERRKKDERRQQTTRMAVTIVANALTVHDGVANAHKPIPSLDELASGGPLDKARTLEAWERILEINYWPIFDVARKVLVCIPEAEARRLIEYLRAAADELAKLGITTTQDLAGQMFGRLIADRKFLATFYTRPESAALLAELAAARLGADWADAESVEALRVADLACGTGALLSAAYRAVAGALAARGRRRSRAPPPDDGTVADRCRHYARRRAPHRLDALQRAACPALRAHAHLHDAVRTCRWRRNRYRLARPDQRNRAARAVRNWPERTRHGGS